MQTNILLNYLVNILMNLMDELNTLDSSHTITNCIVFIICNTYLVVHLNVHLAMSMTLNRQLQFIGVLFIINSLMIMLWSQYIPCADVRLPVVSIIVITIAATMDRYIRDAHEW